MNPVLQRPGFFRFDGDDGVPADRALEWRDDTSYPAVCEAIVGEVYPDALRSAFPDPSTDTEGVIGWFSRNTGAGRSAATGMAGFYGLLSEGDPQQAARASNGGAGTSKKAAGKKTAAPKKTAASRSAQDSSKTGSGDRGSKTEKISRADPEVNINLQIHIDSSASANQIDQIFKSMAEHLYGGS